MWKGSVSRNNPLANRVNERELSFVKLLVCAGNPIDDREELRFGQTYDSTYSIDCGFHAVTRLLDAVSVSDRQRRQGWLEGGLRRWKDRGGWCPLLVALCATGRATLVEPKRSAGSRVGLRSCSAARVPSSLPAARCIAALGRLPAELQGRILQHVGRLDLKAAIDIWFVRDCCGGKTAEELEGN